MPGSNAGTGHRLRPRCVHCARLHPYHHARDKHIGCSLQPTGRRRLKPTGNNASGRVDPQWQYEVVCGDCTATGWHRHVQIARDWAELTGHGRQRRSRR